MTTNAALDWAKFAKVCALYRSTTYAGERQAAHRKMQLFAKAAGLPDRLPDPKQNLSLMCVPFHCWGKHQPCALCPSRSAVSRPPTSRSFAS